MSLIYRHISRHALVAKSRRGMEPRRNSVIFLALSFTVMLTLIFFEFRNGRSGYYSIKSYPNIFAKGKTEVLPPTERVISDPKKRRLILIYTNLFSNREWYHLPAQDASKFADRCEFSNCEVTYDRNRLAESDAVVFHARDMPSPKSLKEMSAKSRPFHQIWAYFISENPYNTPDRRPLDGLFNWTMTYKKESDIWLPYKSYHELKDTEDRPKTVDYAAAKNKVPNRKLAMWISSHCGTLRDQYVKKLQEHISVSVAGGCASQFKNPFRDCNNGGKLACNQHIREHKFYLSFENSFCDQYVTEKYWYNALEFDSVPVVFGGGPYNDPKVAIPGSYINVEDFSTVKELADYLLYLDKNDTAYNEYFKWKQRFKLTDELGWPFPDIFTCEICRKLFTENKKKVYDKLSDFWSNGDCDGKDGKVKNIINNR